MTITPSDIFLWITCLLIITFFVSFLGPIPWWHSFHCFGGFVEEHCRVWLSVILHRHGTHSVPACLLTWESLCWGNFIVLQFLRTIHESPHWTCSLELQETNEAWNILGCLDYANDLWVSSIHWMGPHRTANAVAGGVGVHGRRAHWADISHVCVVSMSHGLLSFSIIVLVVFCIQFSLSYLLWCHY